MNNELSPVECVSSAEASVPATASAEAIHNQQISNSTHHQLITPTSLAFGEASNSAGGNARRAATTIRTCRYFLRGNCRHGARCKFSHNATEEGDLNNHINHHYHHHNLNYSHNSRNGSNASLTQTTIMTTTTPMTTTTSAINACMNISTTTSVSSSSLSQTSYSDSHTNYAKLVKWAEAPAFVPRNPRMISTPQDIETEALNNAIQAELLTTHHQHHLHLHRHHHHHQHQQNHHQPPHNITEPKTWAEVVSGAERSSDDEPKLKLAPASVKSLCPYRGCCPYADKCTYALHWELCKMCDKFCLHPTDMEQRRRHNKKCVQRHQEDMEISFAVARSRDKVCGICMEVILEMPRGMRRFGILPQCNHVFCLGCIRKWRQMPDFSHSVTRSCPQCRVTSSFICPSLYWVDTKEQKDQLIKDYRASLGRKDCKYFKMGKGKCPFGNRCFYKHALPNGEKVENSGANRMRKAATQSNRGSNVRVVNLVDFCLWDFVEQRDMSCMDSLLQGNNFVSVVDYDTDSD